MYIHTFKRSRNIYPAVRLAAGVMDSPPIFSSSIFLFFSFLFLTLLTVGRLSHIPLFNFRQQALCIQISYILTWSLSHCQLLHACGEVVAYILQHCSYHDPSFSFFFRVYVISILVLFLSSLLKLECSFFFFGFVWVDIYMSHHRSHVLLDTTVSRLGFDFLRSFLSITEVFSITLSFLWVSKLHIIL